MFCEGARMDLHRRVCFCYIEIVTWRIAGKASGRIDRIHVLMRSEGPGQPEPGFVPSYVLFALRSSVSILPTT